MNPTLGRQGLVGPLLGERCPLLPQEARGRETRKQRARERDGPSRWEKMLRASWRLREGRGRGVARSKPKSERTKSEVGSPPRLLSIRLSVCLWWSSVSRVVWWDPKSFPSLSRPPAIFRGPVWFGWSPTRMWDLLIKDSKQLVTGWALVEVQVVRVKCVIVLLSVSSHVISTRVSTQHSMPANAAIQLP